MRKISLAVFCFWFALPLFAQTADDTVEAGQIVNPRSSADGENAGDAAFSGLFAGNEESFTAMAMNLLGLVLVLCGFAVVAWYLFRKGVFKKTFKHVEGNLKISENRMLGNRQFLMVVEYEDNKVLLGVSPGKIDYLTTLESGYRKEFPTLEPEFRAMEEKA
ncbi:MAG: flagellar biosynthetic protein FliO [Verrucomicrobiota bacterium]